MAIEDQAPLGSVRDCFGCGRDNPYGLRLAFTLEGGRAVARFAPNPVYQGYPGVLHGGLVATILDEAMSWTLLLRDIWAQTARMQVRYRRNAPADRPLIATGWLQRDRGRTLLAQASLAGEDGTLYAESEGIFFRLPQGQQANLRRRYGLD